MAWIRRVKNNLFDSCARRINAYNDVVSANGFCDCKRITEHMADDAVMVSVICNAFNHEKYIASALDSFLMQKTNFLVEILIHDDASTDKTADIIREYASRYPNIIKPLYQTENQYSKGIKITKCFQAPRVSGKYIAFCEGDDYWLDPYKLQKQFEAMEKHPEIDMCAHGAWEETNKLFTGAVCPADRKKILSPRDVINGSGGFMATASLFYRAELEKMEYPKFREIFSVDYTIQIQGALRGGILYLPDIMAAYRQATESSWTRKMKAVPQRRIQHHYRIIEALNQLDKDTDYIYTKIIHSKIADRLFNVQRLQQKSVLLLKKDLVLSVFRKIGKRIHLVGMYICIFGKWIQTFI